MYMLPFQQLPGSNADIKSLVYVNVSLSLVTWESNPGAIYIHSFRKTRMGLVWYINVECTEPVGFMKGNARIDTAIFPRSI